MNNTVITEIRRCTGGRAFYLSLIAMVIALIALSAGTFMDILKDGRPQDYGYHNEFFLDALQSDTILFLLPVLCALPATASFIDDMKSGFIKLYMPRSGKGYYVKGKLAACILGGGGIPLAGALIFYLMAVLLLLPMELALSAGETAPYYLHRLIAAFSHLFLNGALWSVCGMTLAALTMSRYVAYASPFVCYYLLIILHERYVPALAVIYPKEWLFSQRLTMLCGFIVPILLIEIIAIVSIVFVACFERRLENG